MTTDSIKSDIFILIGLSAGGYGLFLCHGVGVCCEVIGSILFLLGAIGHRNIKPKGQ